MSFSIGKNGIFDPEGKYPNPLTGQPYSQSYKSLALGNKAIGKKGWTELAAWKARVDIIKKIHQNQVLLLVLPTGVGKTVIVPNLLLHYFAYKKKVVVTVPRLPLTSESGGYAAKRLDVPLYTVDNNGNEIINPDAKDNEEKKYRTNNKIVGYKTSSVGSKFGDKDSVLLFTTDGNIKQSIVSGDKDLSNYGGIIIDEAHERSVNIDILIALVMDIVPRRPDFKVIIMSATIKKETFTNYFKRIGLGDKYGTFDLPELIPNFKINFQPTLKNVNTNNIVEEVYKKINDILLDPTKTKGDILGFVTSESEIIKIQRKIDKNIDKYSINNKPYTIAFSAGISPGNKDIAVGKIKINDIKPTHNAPQGFSRRVIIATNAVESSITFEAPMVYVIDTGLAFEKKYDAKNYAYETGKFLVSQASIKQRCGRTGRNCDGFCIQLYTTEQFSKLSEYTIPKILVEEFTDELLSLAIINGNIPNAFKFMSKMIEEPSTYKESISRAYHNLLNMNLIDDAGNVTNLGFVCSKFNNIKIAKMIIGGYYMGCMNWSIILGAILTVKDISFEKVFFKPPFMDEDPKLEEQYKNIVKKNTNENGDHISLLIIFNNFISVPQNNRKHYAEENGLDYYTLSSIQEKYLELEKTVKQQIHYIKNLNLFDVPSEVLVFGGGKVDGDNNDSLDSSDDDDFSDDDFSDDDSSDDDSSDASDASDASDDDASIDEELEKDEAEFKNYINKKTSQTGGVADSNDSNSDEDDNSDSDNDLDDSLDYEDEYAHIDVNNISQKKIDAINKDYNTYKINGGSQRQNNISIKKGKFENTIEGGFQNTNKNNYTNNDILDRNSKTSRKLTIKNNRHITNITNNTNNTNITNNTNQKRTKTNININMNGGSIEDDKKIKKRRFIMDFIDIKNLKQISITPPSSLIDRILSSLYYGYSNNIACYSGNSNKYYVKFSPKQGSIESTSFDFINKKPDFIIYNEFSINKDMGSKGAKLSIVSEINSHHFGQFIDFHELKKKLKDM